MTASPAKRRPRLRAHGAWLWYAPAVLLGLVPLLLWSGPFSNLMSINGDDSLLYYYDPSAYLAHIPNSVLDVGFLGFNARPYFIPFVFTLQILAWVPFNVQTLVTGLAMATAYVGLFKLTLLLVDSRSTQAHVGGVFAGVVGVSAPLLMETQYSHYLPGLFWQVLIPWSVLLFAWHQKTGQTRWLVAMAALVAVLAPTVSAVAWTVPSLLLVVMLGATLLITGSFRFRFKRLVSMLAVVVACNLFWLGPMAYNFTQGNSQVADSTSGQTVDGSIKAVKETVALGDATDTLSLRLSSDFLAQAPQKAANDHSRALGFLGFVPSALVLLSLGLLVKRRKEKHSRRLLLCLTVTGLVFFYFASIVALPGGMSVFAWMMRNVPGWIAVRNYYDRFAIPFVAISALAGACALWFLLRNISARKSMAIGLVLSASMAAYAWPHLGGAEFRVRQGNGHTDRIRALPGLPADYRATLDELGKLPPGPILTMPLTSAQWSIVPSDTTRGLYLGVSPIFALTGRSDFNSDQAFKSSADPTLQQRVAKIVAAGDVDAFTEVVQSAGVRYMITSSDAIAPGWGAPSRYGVSLFGDARSEAAFTQKMRDKIAARAVVSSGRFTVYAIKPDVYRPFVGLTPTKSASASAQSDLCAQGNDFLQRSATSFVLRASLVPADCQMILRMPTSSNWRATLVSDNERQTLFATKNDFGSNTFAVPASATPVELEVDYTPASILGRAQILSALVAAATLIVGFMMHRRRKRRNETVIDLDSTNASEQLRHTQPAHGATSRI